MNEQLKDATGKLVEAVKEFAGVVKDVVQEKAKEFGDHVEPMIDSAHAKATQFAGATEGKLDELRKKVHEATADPK